jgi:membrane associated rhomboid family serine protease
MGYASRSYALRYSGSGGLPPGIKWLLISNIAIFILQFFLRLTEIGDPLFLMRLVPVQVVSNFFVWQLASYMFLHGGFGHIIWNMLALWMFGADLEHAWGTRRFLRFYFFCGIGAGICVVVGNYLFGNPRIATIGSSGAIYGILLAYAVLFPDRQILFGFLIPIKVKYFVAIIGVVAFMQTFGSVNSGVSNVAHLGGMLFAFIFMKMPAIKGFDPLSTVGGYYREWRLQRAKRKFQVYLKKHRSNTRVN